MGNAAVNRSSRWLALALLVPIALVLAYALGIVAPAGRAPPVGLPAPPPGPGATAPPPGPTRPSLDDPPVPSALPSGPARGRARAEPKPVYDRPDPRGEVVASLRRGSQVLVLCTVVGEPFTAGGEPSAGWAYTGSGYVPTALVDTGRAAHLAPPCPAGPQ